MTFLSIPGEFREFQVTGVQLEACRDTFNKKTEADGLWKCTCYGAYLPAKSCITVLLERVEVDFSFIYMKRFLY